MFVFLNSHFAPRTWAKSNLWMHVLNYSQSLGKIGRLSKSSFHDDIIGFGGVASHQWHHGFDGCVICKGGGSFQNKLKSCICFLKPVVPMVEYW